MRLGNLRLAQSSMGANRLSGSPLWPDQPVQRLGDLAHDLEAEFVGGTPFFDHLDESLRDPYWYQQMLARYLDAYPMEPRIALSGEFGRGFAQWLRETTWQVPLVFPGNLRHNDLPPLPLHLDGEQFVFLDDSYYKGRTRAKVTKAIEDAGGMVVGSFVLYDGSPEAAAINSCFRYHPDTGSA